MRQALEMALEALETYHGYMEPLLTVFGGPRVPEEQSTTWKVEHAITAIKEALAQPKKLDQDEVDIRSRLGHPLPEREAVLEEREACAKIADEWVAAYPHPSRTIAEWIRKRGQA